MATPNAVPVLVVSFKNWLAKAQPAKTKETQVADGVTYTGGNQGEFAEVETYKTEVTPVTAEDLIAKFADLLELFSYAFKPALKALMAAEAEEYLQA